jgi:hypothetical protein
LSVRADLHSHTSFSDGQHGPAELLRRAREAGLTHLGLTDHDTVAGIAEAREAAAREGLTLVAGIEVSAQLGPREAHILGHFIDPASPELARLFDEASDLRRARMERMVARAVQEGVPVTMDEVERIAQGATLGRPHLARALVARGHVATVQEAFDLWLADGRPLALPRARPAAAEAIRIIRAAGGAATLAHPAVNRVHLEELRKLRAAGLAGLEVRHPRHAPEDEAAFAEMAREADLVATAGSDYHGETIAPQRILGSRWVDAGALAALQARSGGV